MGIGPMTSSLPKKCSTTELRGRGWSRQGRNCATTEGDYSISWRVLQPIDKNPNDDAILRPYNEFHSVAGEQEQ
jgi:hypothetical protein